MGTRLPMIFGALTVLGAILQLIAMTVEQDGLPHDTSTWLNFASKLTVGIGLIVAKQFNTTGGTVSVAPKSS